MVWREDKPIASFDKTATYYYVPLKALTAELEGSLEIDHLFRTAIASGLFPENTKVYGLRKDAREVIANMTNWVNFEQAIIEKIDGIDAATITGMAASTLSDSAYRSSTSDVIKLVDAASPYKISLDAINAAKKIKFERNALQRLINAFSATITQKDILAKVDAEIVNLRSSVDRYPLLAHVNHYVDAAAVAEYINLIDAAKGK